MEAAEAVSVPDCRSCFASSIPAKVPAAATARTRMVTRAAISPVRDPVREAGRGSDGSTGAVWAGAGVAASVGMAGKVLRTSVRGSACTVALAGAPVCGEAACGEML